MGQLKTELVNKLEGFAPFEKILALYKEPEKFFAELNNYMVGGLVLSSPKFFMMLKPVNKTVDPHGQWWAENPDTWYVRWAAGDGVKILMDAVEPLPFIMFRRITPKGETKLRTYPWDKFYKIAK
ncbi:MAG: hypothetical protein CMC15_16795 [Flavobacteriaceae bacterium]|nr:hypothetical protein [Flavobacteriaceae bacterium]